MKFFKRYIHELKPMKFLILLSLLIVIVIMYINLYSYTDEPLLSVLDCLTHLQGVAGTTSTNMFVYVLIPMFVVLSLLLMDYKENSVFILKHQSRMDIWDKMARIMVLLSFVFTILIVFGGYFLAGLLLGSFENKWISEDGMFYYFLGENEKQYFLYYAKSLTTPKILITLFFIKFIALIMIAFLAMCLKTMMHNNIFVFIIVVVFSYIDAFFLENSIFMHVIGLDINHWKNINGILFNLLYLLSITILLYYIGKKTYNKRDFLN